MANPFLVPCLVQLRTEFNTEAPHRDKGADGWIGDEEHQKEVSDHNPRPDGKVLALDIDTTGPWPDGYTLDTYVNTIIDRCRSGEETRIEYIIRHRKIYERHNGYAARDYSGKDPHDNHAHFSARHDLTGWNDERTWFMLSASDKTWLREEIGNVAQAVWDVQVANPDPADTNGRQAASSALVYGPYDIPRKTSK